MMHYQWSGVILRYKITQKELQCALNSDIPSSLVLPLLQIESLMKEAAEEVIWNALMKGQKQSLIINLMVVQTINVVAAMEREWVFSFVGLDAKVFPSGNPLQFWFNLQW